MSNLPIPNGGSASEGWRGVSMGSIGNRLAILVAVCAFSGCDKELTPQQEQRELIRIQASITASFWVSAQRACRVVGLDDVRECAELKGSRLNEQSAQMMAKLATDQTVSYRENCRAMFSEGHCARLVLRAIAMENRKPQPSESQPVY